MNEPPKVAGMGRVVQMSAHLEPTGHMKSILENAKAKMNAAPGVAFDKPNVGSGTLELRVFMAPRNEPKFPKGTVIWAIVESYENGQTELLIGGTKPTVVEASVEGSAALDSLLTTFGKG